MFDPCSPVVIVLGSAEPPVASQGHVLAQHHGISHTHTHHALHWHAHTHPVVHVTLPPSRNCTTTPEHLRQVFGLPPAPPSPVPVVPAPRPIRHHHAAPWRFWLPFAAVGGVGAGGGTGVAVLLHNLPATTQVAVIPPGGQGPEILAPSPTSRIRPRKSRY
jgi:hypothetical protein